VQGLTEPLLVLAGLALVVLARVEQCLDGEDEHLDDVRVVGCGAHRPLLNVSAVTSTCGASMPGTALACPAVKLSTVLRRTVRPGVTITMFRTPALARYSMSPAAR